MQWLSQPSLVTAGLLLVVLRTVLWLLWLLLVLAIMAELAGLGRRIRFLRWRITSPVHRLAAGLVGSLVGGLVVTVAGSAAQAAPPAAAVATQPVGLPGRAGPTPVEHPGTLAGAAEMTASGPPVRPHVDQPLRPFPNLLPNPATSPDEGGAALVYRVAADDYLGDIADRFLGTFDAYPQLSALN